MEEVKPGWKTSEFWVTTLMSGTALLAGLGFLSPEQVDGINTTGAELIVRAFAFVVAALPVLGYNISRGLAKSKK